MPTTSINGCALYWEEAGSGSPLVYIHGGFASLDTRLRDLQPLDWSWEHDLAAHHRFVTYDRRGCYRSSLPDGGWELTVQADDLRALLDHLHIAAANLIGSSAGGPIAIVFAATYPRRTRSLVLVGTALDLFPAHESGSDAVRQQLEALDSLGADAAFERRPSEVEVTQGELWDAAEAAARGTPDQYRERQQRWREAARQLPRAERVRYYAGELRNMQAYMDADIGSFAARVTAPTLVLHGSRDQLVPTADAATLARAIPGARLRVVDGGSHSLVIRDAGARRIVLDFVAEATSEYCIES